MISLGKYFPAHPFNIDGEDVPLRVQRLDLNEYNAFAAEFGRYNKGARGSNLAELKDALQRIADDASIAADRELLANIVSKLDTLVAQLPGEAAKPEPTDNEAAEFIRESLAYVRIPEGQIKDEDASAGDRVVWITEGQQLARYFGARPDLLFEILSLIFLLNRLSSEQKKTWKSQLVSKPSSDESATAPSGPKPAAIAAPVEPSTTAASELAAASQPTA